MCVHRCIDVDNNSIISKGLLPLAFFGLKENAPLKAPMSVMVSLTALGYALGAVGFAVILTYELSVVTVTHQLNISGWDCNALGAFSNEKQTLAEFRPFRSSTGMEVLMDVSLTSAQCTDRTMGLCEAWADQYVGQEACCMYPSRDSNSSCFWNGAFIPYPTFFHAPPTPPPSPPPSPPPPLTQRGWCGGTEEVYRFDECSYNAIGEYTCQGQFQSIGISMKAALYTMTFDGLLPSKSSTPISDVPGIHTPQGLVGNGSLYSSFYRASQAPLHVELYKKLTRVPRSVLALTTCTFMGGIETINHKSQAVSGNGLCCGSYALGNEGMPHNCPDPRKPCPALTEYEFYDGPFYQSYLTTKILQRYPSASGSDLDEDGMMRINDAKTAGEHKTRANIATDLVLERATFTSDCQVTLGRDLFSNG